MYLLKIIKTLIFNFSHILKFNFILSLPFLVYFIKRSIKIGSFLKLIYSINFNCASSLKLKGLFGFLFLMSF
jgi:hypothetical protein